MESGDCIEVERKFILTKKQCGELIKNISPFTITQGYVVNDENNQSVRIRVNEYTEEVPTDAILTIKSRSCEFVRSEVEFQVPVNKARYLLNQCSETISKQRYVIEAVDSTDDTWLETPNAQHVVVDVFQGDLVGLIMMEVELLTSDQEIVGYDAYLDAEVTGDSRFYNANLVKKHPSLEPST